MSLASMLNLTCTIQQKARTAGASGGNVQTWTTRASGVRCSIQPATGRQREAAQRETGETEFSAYFLPDQTIAVSDRITAVAGLAQALANLTLEVTSVGMDAAGRGCYKRVEAMTVTNEDGLQ